MSTTKTLGVDPVFDTKETRNFKTAKKLLKFSLQGYIACARKQGIVTDGDRSAQELLLMHLQNNLKSLDAVGNWCELAAIIQNFRSVYRVTIERGFPVTRDGYTMTSWVTVMTLMLGYDNQGIDVLKSVDWARHAEQYYPEL